VIARRLRARQGLAPGLVVAALALGGCSAAPPAGGPAGPAGATPTGATTSTTSPAVEPLMITVDGEVVPVAADGTPDYCATLDEPTGSAADRYGAAAVRAGLCDVVTLLLEQGAQDSFDHRDEQPSPEEAVESATFVKEMLAPDAHEWWDEDVAEMSSGEMSTALANVALLALVPYDDGEYRPATRDGRGYTTAVLDVGDVWLSDSSGEGRVSVEVEQTVDLDLTREADGTAWVLPYERSMTLTLVPGPDPERPFLIDVWSGRFRLDGIQDRDGELAEPTASASS